MAKSENSHLPWPSRIVAECSTQNPKIEILNPAPGTGKEKNDEIAKNHICCCPCSTVVIECSNQNPKIEVLKSCPWHWESEK